MAIADNYAPTKVQGNGVTVAFTFVWNMISTAYEVVTFENVATGVQTIQSTGFTITLDSDGSGGTVTFVTPPPDTVYVIISRDAPASQETTYKTSSGFQAKVVEDSLDLGIAVIQQEKDAIDRSPKTKVGGTLNIVFPEPEADKAIGWNEAGDALENKVSPDEAVDEAAASAAAALVSENAAAASETAAAASENAAAASETAAADSAAGVNLPSIAGGDAEKQLFVNSGESGYELKAINEFTAKTSPVAADLIIIEDSADSNAKKKVTLTNVLTLTGFVDRGDLAAFDFELGDLTTDGNWYDLDLSSIVPAGVRVVLISVLIQDDATSSKFKLRENGNSNIINVIANRTQVANVAIEASGVVACDSNRVIEYWAENLTWSSINITIRGWWL